MIIGDTDTFGPLSVRLLGALSTRSCQLNIFFISIAKVVLSTISDRVRQREIPAFSVHISGAFLAPDRTAYKRVNGEVPAVWVWHVYRVVVRRRVTKACLLHMVKLEVKLLNASVPRDYISL